MLNSRWKYCCLLSVFKYMFKHTTITKNCAHSFNYMLVVKKINFTYVYIYIVHAYHSTWNKGSWGPDPPPPWKIWTTLGSWHTLRSYETFLANISWYRKRFGPEKLKMPCCRGWWCSLALIKYDLSSRSWHSQVICHLLYQTTASDIFSFKSYRQETKLI